MIKIYYTVEEIFKKEYVNHSKEFREGFSHALRLFRIGFEKRTDFNKSVKIHEQEIEIKELRKVIRQLDEKIIKMAETIEKTSLISGLPLNVFHEFFVDSGVGSFKIVTNMDRDTINACLINFAARTQFKQVDEAKSKLIQYINSKSVMGFKAYKDKSIAIKEGVKVE